MPSAPLPADEPARLDALRACGVLDTPPEECFDEITRMATLLTGCPMATVSLVDADRQWFKSRVGVEASETPRSISLCGHTILGREPLIIEDASKDPRVSDSPLVTNPGGLRFYAGFPIALESGHVVGALCVIDTAPRRLSVNEVAFLRLLAKQVATTLELRRTVRRLDAALADARQAARTKQRFLANASHELRTPLSVVSMSAESLLESFPADAPLTESLRLGLDQLNDIVGRLLELAATERNEIVLSTSRCDVAREIREVSRLFSPQAQARSVPLVTSLDASLPGAVDLDAQRLRQVLSFLVSNAVKFTRAGRVKILASWSNDQLSIAVEDTGIGMDPARIESLFTPLEVGDDSEARREGGLGLGLPLARRLAHLMGGDLQCASEPGKGTRMTLNLRAPRSAQVDPAADARHGPAAPLGSPADLPSKVSGRVLVAEDGADNQRIVRHMLERLGANVTIVANGAEAIAQLAASPFDLVLMDMQMPELDGYEATRRLRAGGHRGPIVALTAHAMSTDRQRCLDAGCDEYVTKPFTKNAIAQLCARYLRPAA